MCVTVFAVVCTYRVNSSVRNSVRVILRPLYNAARSGRADIGGELCMTLT